MNIFFVAEIVSESQLTIGVTLEEGVEHLKMTGNLLSGSSLAGQLEDVLGNELVSSIRLSTLGPFSPAHWGIGFQR